VQGSSGEAIDEGTTWAVGIRGFGGIKFSNSIPGDEDGPEPLPPRTFAGVITGRCRTRCWNDVERSKSSAGPGETRWGEKYIPLRFFTLPPTPGFFLSTSFIKSRQRARCHPGRA